jgi:hypothetical protein
VNWNATYELSAEGAVSSASISAGYSETDVGADDVLVPPTLFFKDSQPNDGEKAASPSGSLVVSVRPRSVTEQCVFNPKLPDIRLIARSLVLRGSENGDHVPTCGPMGSGAAVMTTG